MRVTVVLRIRSNHCPTNISCMCSAAAAGVADSNQHDSALLGFAAIMWAITGCSRHRADEP